MACIIVSPGAGLTGAGHRCVLPVGRHDHFLLMQLLDVGESTPFRRLITFTLDASEVPDLKERRKLTTNHIADAKSTGGTSTRRIAGSEAQIQLLATSLKPPDALGPSQPSTQPHRSSNSAWRSFGVAWTQRPAPRCLFKAGGHRHGVPERSTLLVVRNEVPLF